MVNTETVKNDDMSKEAATIARMFIMTLNGSMLYGCNHPSTAKNASTLCEAINGGFSDDRQMITVIVNNGALIIEDYPLDKGLNSKKIIAHFDKIGVISISFESGLQADSVARLVELIGDSDQVEMCRAEISGSGERTVIPNIRINYITYGKIKADEVVVKEFEAAPPAIFAQASDGGAQTKELLDAFGKIKGEMDASSENLSIDELLKSLYELKKGLHEAIEVQRATGKIMRSADVINNELNDLTARAIAKLAKDEYKSGKTPLNRLARAIRRMLPNSVELIQVLPQLKEMLLSDGMTLGDYLELVNMLGLKIESEELSDSLKTAAESMGATVGDLVAAIRSKPEEAARLILLASEIRGGNSENESRLSEVLTGYIEEVCSKMAAESREYGDSANVKTVLARLESQMCSQLPTQLAAQGISQPILQDVKKLLSERFDGALAQVNENLTENVPTPSAAKLKLPAGALNANNLLFLINNEIKRGLRYKTPFATLTASIEKVVENDKEYAPKPDDLAELIPQLFATSETMLRDVDIIGIIGASERPELFILLPMTDAEGTAIVKDRLIEQSNARVYTLANNKASVVIKVSATQPTATTKDLKSYLTLSRHNHKNALSCGAASK